MVLVTSGVHGENYINDIVREDSSKPEKDRLMHVIKGRFMCEHCIQVGHIACDHLLGLLPPWHSTDGKSVTELLLHDSPEVLMIESLGVSLEDSTIRIYREEWLQGIASFAEDDSRPSNFSQVFVAVDPASGGRKSEFAIVSCCFTEKGELVVRKKLLFIFDFQHFDRIPGRSNGYVPSNSNNVFPGELGRLTIVQGILDFGEFRFCARKVSERFRKHPGNAQHETKHVDMGNAR